MENMVKFGVQVQQWLNELKHLVGESSDALEVLGAHHVHLSLLVLLFHDLNVRAFLDELI